MVPTALPREHLFSSRHSSTPDRNCTHAEVKVKAGRLTQRATGRFGFILGYSVSIQHTVFLLPLRIKNARHHSDTAPQEGHLMFTFHSILLP
jgi:hypothetical protein